MPIRLTFWMALHRILINPPFDKFKSWTESFGFSAFVRISIPFPWVWLDNGQTTTLIEIHCLNLGINVTRTDVALNLTKRVFPVSRTRVRTTAHKRIPPTATLTESPWKVDHPPLKLGKQNKTQNGNRRNKNKKKTATIKKEKLRFVRWTKRIRNSRISLKKKQHDFHLYISV